MIASVTDSAALTAQNLLAMSPQQMEEALKGLKPKDAGAQLLDWHFWRREEQTPPDGFWRIWLVMAGRGFGKTRMGAEWVSELALTQPGVRIALIGATMNEARQVMVEGESGLLSLSTGGLLTWEPSLRRVRWPNGSAATLYSASEPESMRGPQHHFAWADEIAKWGCGIAAWDNLMLGMRLGVHPQVMATTTPRPVPLIKRLVAERGVAVTTGRTMDNADNLPPGFITAVDTLYGGTRLGRQELDGELIEDIDGALWNRDLIERQRVAVVPEMKRIVIGVDPPITAHGDACGIIAVGLGVDDKAYVLADHSVRGASPEVWARAVASAAESWNADRVVAEGNQGGEMVTATLRAADLGMSLKRVHASRGKSARAEPIAALYEAGRAWHLGAFPALEDEMCGLIMGGRYEGPGRSPDRADALVWAMGELMLGRSGGVVRVRGL
jgi:phage terminase large subunit-like protein